MTLSAFRAALTAERRRRRLEYPDGRYDALGRWYPSDAERRSCCERVRQPSRRWAWSLLRHCASVKHCAALYGADQSEVKRLLPVIGLLPNELLLPAETPEDLVARALERIEGNGGTVAVLFDTVRTVADRLGVVRNWVAEWERVQGRIRVVPFEVVYLDEIMEG